MEISVGVERSPHDQTRSNERERHMAVLRMILFPCCSSEVVFFLRSSLQFLLNGYTIDVIPKNVESVKTSSQGCVTVESLMVNGTERKITAVDLCNNEELVSLAHDIASI